MRFIYLFATLLLLSQNAFASISLPRIFSNNMVLQCDEPLKIWGTSLENADIVIKIDETTKFTTRANNDGKWSVIIPKLKASNEPKEIKFFENSDLSKSLKNVLVGEVWISGGQSNMEFKLKNSIGGSEAIKDANFPNIRFFRQASVPSKTPQFDSPKGATWYVCTPKNVPDVSAVGFYFARDLYENLNTPIGIVETAFSGSYMITWLAKQDLMGIDAFETPLKKFEKDNENYDYEKAKEKFKSDLKIYNESIKNLSKEEVKKIKKPSPPQLAIGTKLTAYPAMFYNSKIAPIAGFNARGFIWYQGESDAIANPEAFEEKFARLISSWRKYWNKSDMPFYFVQLPSIERKSWVEVRQFQDNVSKKLKNVKMAVSIDTGDIKDVHPKEKLCIGKRLARLAFIDIYGKKNLADFPKVKSVNFNKNTALISFDSKNSKMKFKDAPRGIEVLVGSDWIEPKIEIKNDKLLLKSDSLDIQGVRYLWKSWAYPDVFIFNEDELPLAPFSINKK